MPECTRPIVRYHGGKWRLASWIIDHLPDHRIYVEPFGGGGSVLLRKPRSYAEIYNDLDDAMVNLFRVVRDDGDALAERLRLTPFARAEFMLAREPSDDPVEQARRTLIRAFMGFGSNGINRPTGFRSNATRSYTTPSHDWMRYPEALKAIVARLQGVVVEHKDALELIRQHDTPETLFYVDPPYVANTRDKGPDYRYEMDDEDHERLADTLHTVRGAVVLSGYRCALYDRLYAGWRRVEKPTYADGARKRVETLWLSPGRVLKQSDFVDELFAHPPALERAS